MRKLKKEITFGNHVFHDNFTYGDWVEVGDFNHFENVYLGHYSYTGPFTMLQNVRVLNFSNIAANVRIGATDHPMERVTMHHITYRRVKYGLDIEDDIPFFEARKNRITTIGHDTWIGHGAIIKPGLTIGHGSVVGSGSVVTKNVPNFAIVVGNPAKVIRYRFPENIQNDLLSIGWWDWPEDIVRERYLEFMLPIETFIEKYRKKEV